jgi:hypothetical protein
VLRFHNDMGVISTNLEGRSLIPDPTENSRSHTDVAILINPQGSDERVMPLLGSDHEQPLSGRLMQKSLITRLESSSLYERIRNTESATGIGIDRNTSNVTRLSDRVLHSHSRSGLSGSRDGKASRLTRLLEVAHVPTSEGGHSSNMRLNDTIRVVLVHVVGRIVIDVRLDISSIDYERVEGTVVIRRKVFVSKTIVDIILNVRVVDTV